MLGVTVFGIFFTPVFYVVVRGFTDRPAEEKAPTTVTPGHEPRTAANQ